MFLSPEAIPLMLSSTPVEQLLARAFAGAEALEQDELDEAERVDVGVPALDRALEDRHLLQQRLPGR